MIRHDINRKTIHLVAINPKGKKFYTTINHAIQQIELQLSYKEVTSIVRGCIDKLVKGTVTVLKFEPFKFSLEEKELIADKITSKEGYSFQGWTFKYDV
jgi:hypothetical protein